MQPTGPTGLANAPDACCQDSGTNGTDKVFSLQKQHITNMA
jgi:hypothetical protein